MQARARSLIVENMEEMQRARLRGEAAGYLAKDRQLLSTPSKEYLQPSRSDFRKKKILAGV
jgi:hypothetical protein